MSILSIYHLIFLSRKERYDLYFGKDITTVGTSVPVWYKDGKTSEPAKEVFVKYHLLNRKEPVNLEIKNNEYEITISSKSSYNNLEDMIDIQYPNINDLLDIKDGGVQWLAFKQNKKSDQFHIVHFVQIKDIEELHRTLI